MMASSLRGRVAAATSVGTALLVVGGALFSYVRVRHHLDRSLERFIEHEVYEVLEELAEEREPFHPFTVRSRDGTILARSEDLPDGLPLIDDAPPVNRGEGELRIATVTLPGRSHSYRIMQLRLPAEGRTVSVAASRAIIEGALENYAESLLVAVPLLALLVAVSSWFLARSSLRPLDRVIRIAEEIHVGDLSARLPESGVAEVRRLSRVLNRMLARLEEGVGAIRRFSTDAAHELRTPLAVLRGELDLLLESRDDENSAPALVRAIDEATELSRLVEDLLLVTRGRSSVAPEVDWFDLSALTREVAEDAGIVARERKLAFHASIPDGLRLKGHRRLLRRVLWNLLDNAIKFTDEGGVQLTLETTHTGICLRVSDTGCGIAAEDLDRVFDRFFRGSASTSRRSGNGLGLALVRWICRVHGGSITARSEEGKGSVFEIFLPLEFPA